MKIEFLQRYRRTVELSIWGLILLMGFVINLVPFADVSQNLSRLNLILFIIGLFTLVYYRILAPRIRRFEIIMVTILVYVIFILAFIHYSGGLNSIFLGLLFVPLLVSAQLLGENAVLLVFSGEVLILVGEYLWRVPLRELISLELFERLMAQIISLGIVGSIAMINGREVNRRMVERDLLIREKNRWRRLKRKSDAVIHSIKDGVLVVNNDKTIISANSSANKILRVKRGQKIVGVNYENLLPLRSRTGKLIQGTDEDPIALVLKGKEDFIQGIYFIDSDLAERIYLHLRVSLLAHGFSEREGVLVTFSDVTEEEELNRMKIDFVSMASHELRTPITAILGYLALLKEEAGKKLAPEENKFLERAYVAGQRLEALIENLLSVSRIERGQLNLRLEKVDWNALVKETIIDFKEQAESSGLELKSELADNLPPVWADKLRIREVLNNLIGNAINYTQHGSITVRTFLAAHKNEVITMVRDTGPGIPAEAIPHLFTKFYRVAGILEQGSKGTGLGLYISQAIVNAHRGRIWVKSKLGEGSSFYFSLPVADS